MSNKAIEALRKARIDASNQAENRASNARYHEGEASMLRTQEAQLRKIVADCDAALVTLEAADRRIRLYGREVLQ